MSHTSTIMKIFHLAFDQAQTLQFIRDNEQEGKELTKEQKKHLSSLEKIVDICMKDPYFFQPNLSENGDVEFDFVTAEWIEKMLEWSV